MPRDQIYMERYSYLVCSYLSMDVALDVAAHAQRVIGGSIVKDWTTDMGEALIDIRPAKGLDFDDMARLARPLRLMGRYEVSGYYDGCERRIQPVGFPVDDHKDWCRITSAGDCRSNKDHSINAKTHYLKPCIRKLFPMAALERFERRCYVTGLSGEDEAEFRLRFL